MAVFAICLVLLAVLFCVSMMTGTVHIGFKDLCTVLTNGRLSDDDSYYYNIIYSIRLPRILLSIVTGGGLAVSGFLLQTYFRNPIAGPYILGISSGAKLMVTILLIVLLPVTGSISSVEKIAAAFIGSMICTAVILILSDRIRNMAAILIGGMMLSYVFSALTDLMINFADDKDVVSLRSWSQGTYSGSSMENVVTALVIIVPCTVFAFLMSKEIFAVSLSENYGRSVGVNVRLFRIILILISSLLSAVVTALCGPVSFIGVAAPYVMRRLLGSDRPQILIPGVFLMGGLFTCFSDLLARMLFAPTELGISTVTSLFGAPVVLYMLLTNRRNR